MSMYYVRFFFKKVLVFSKENLRNTEKREYLGKFSNYIYERLHLGLFLKQFSESKTVTFTQKVIYLRCLPTTKLLLTADG